jgi:hypothetical protein
MINLSWSISKSLSDEGGNIDDSDWLTVTEKLNLVMESAGSVGLETEDDHEKIRSLSVRAENGAYLLTIGVETAEDWIVRTYKNPNVEAPGQLVDILGDRWNSQFICNDVQVRKKISHDVKPEGQVQSTGLKSHLQNWSRV